MICSQTRLVGIGIDDQQMLFILFYFILLALPRRIQRYANKILGQGHRNS